MQRRWHGGFELAAIELAGVTLAAIELAGFELADTTLAAALDALLLVLSLLPPQPINAKVNANADIKDNCFNIFILSYWNGTHFAINL